MAVHRAVAVGILALVAAALASGCSPEPAEVEAARPSQVHTLDTATSKPVAPVDAPTGTLYLVSLRATTLLVVDVASGRVRPAPTPIAGGDPPYQLARSGDRLVMYGGNRTYSVSLDMRFSRLDLGESWYFVPSATEGRVWLMVLDSASPVRDLAAVREVAVDGGITLAPEARPPSRGPSILAAVDAGLLYQERERLALWDPRSDRVLLRLPGPFVADTHANLVAWCDAGCARFHITDAGTGEDMPVAPGEDFHFEETYNGAFSPNGRVLALPVQTSIGETGVALVDVESARARLIPGAVLDPSYQAMAWSPDGKWLFLAAEDRRISAYSFSDERLVLLPTVLDHDVIDMEAGAAIG